MKYYKVRLENEYLRQFPVFDKIGEKELSEWLCENAHWGDYSEWDQKEWSWDGWLERTYWLNGWEFPEAGAPYNGMGYIVVFEEVAETKKFQFAIFETLRREVSVEAADEDEAQALVERMYRNEEIVLEADDFFENEIRYLGEEKVGGC